MARLAVKLVADDETSAEAFVVLCIGCGAKSSPQPRATLAEDVALCREGFAKYAKGAKCPRCRASGIPLEARVGWVGGLCKRLGLDVPQPVPQPALPETEATEECRARPRARKPKSTEPKTTRTTTSKRGTKA